MGFFSFKTCDTDRSIANIYSGKPVRTVYLLQPNGDKAIAEPAYEGNGVFGGIDCYEWLAKMNFGDSSLTMLAINADCGAYYENDDAIFLCSMHIKPDMESVFRDAVKKPNKPIVFFENYESTIAALDGRSMNNAVACSDVWSAKIPLKYPLKFSFDPKAIYEQLPPSEPCEYQGYFYE